MLLIVLKSTADPAADVDNGVLEEAEEDTGAKDDEDVQEVEEDAATAEALPPEPSTSSRLGPLKVLLPSP